MPILSACCCYSDLRDGSRASAVFSVVTGLINTVIDIWLLVNLHYLDGLFEENEKYALLVPGILFFIYLELACNLALVGLSCCLWIGINRGYDGKRWIYSWVIAVSGFRIYELLLGIYILAWLGAHRISDIVYVAPESIVIAFYWLINTIILIVAILCVWSYWQDLMDDVYGREKRVKYYSMLSNIRHAARSSKGSRAGTMTPRSYYMSQRSLAPSQASFPQSQHQMGPPVGASSQASLPTSHHHHHGGPPSHHGGPPSHHGGPPSHHGGPPSHHGGPSSHHGGPHPHHGGPPSHHGGPPSHHGAPHRGPPSGYGGPPPQQYPPHRY